MMINIHKKNISLKNICFVFEISNIIASLILSYHFDYTMEALIEFEKIKILMIIIQSCVNVVIFLPEYKNNFKL